MADWGPKIASVVQWFGQLAEVDVEGVPPALRRWVWVEACGAAGRRAAHHPSYYAAMLELGRLESPFVHQILLVGGCTCFVHMGCVD